METSSINFYTEEELVRFLPSPMSWTPYQLFREFPLAASAARRAKKDINQQLFAYQEIVRAQLPRDPFMEGVINEVFIDAPMRELVIRAASLERYLNLCRNKSLGNGPVLADSIARAKEVAISNFIEFNKAGFALCIWHNEKGPSLKYYSKENKVHCFGGCGKSGDVVDVVQGIYQCSFLDAVKKIIS